MQSELDALWLRYGEGLVSAGLNVLAAIVILIVGLWFAAWAGRAVRRLANRHPRFDDTLAAFSAWIVRYGLTLIVLIAVLRRFGFETTSVIALFGAAALAIGLALQGTLSNVAAGVMLILFRPYRIGDSVELNGRGGVVSDINLFVTEIVTPDHTRVMLPNGQCWGAPISNYTAFANRRIDIDFAVAAATGLPAARALAAAADALQAEERLVGIPPPAVQIKSIDHDKTVYTAMAWAPASQQIVVKQSLLKAIKLGLEAAQRDEAARRERAGA